MIEPINLDMQNSRKVEDSTSKGALPKWNIDHKWYKPGKLGYEPLSEFICTKLLEKSNIASFCSYSLEYAIYRDRKVLVSVSNDFRDDVDDMIVTVYKILKLHPNLDKLFAKSRATSDVMREVIELVESECALSGFGEYLTQLLEFDAFILNEDRHFNNITVLRNTAGDYSLCPVFDNGLSLCSDTTDYPLDMPTRKCIEKVKSKPFSTSFKKQVEVARNLHGTQLKFYFDEKYVDEICEEALEFYSSAYVGRVKTILKLQMKRYPEFFISRDFDEQDYTENKDNKIFEATTSFINVDGRYDEN